MNFWTRVTLIAGVATAGLPFSHHTALAAPAASSPASAVASLNSGLAQLEKTSGKRFAERYAALAPVIDNFFDMQTFLQASIGLRWTGFSAADQQSLLKTYRAYMIATYISNFSDPKGPGFKLDSAQRNAGSDILVSTELVSADGGNTTMTYVMRGNASGYHAIDILLNGTISQAAVQRSDFRSLLNGETGPHKLIDMLNEKVTTLSAGTVSP
jgi:phospholipid transport system substrate-binding protein